MWSIGCVFVELLALKPPFPGYSVPEMMSWIISVLGSPPPDVWERCFSSLPEGHGVPEFDVMPEYEPPSRPATRADYSHVCSLSLSLSQCATIERHAVASEPGCRGADSEDAGLGPSAAHHSVRGAVGPVLYARPAARGVRHHVGQAILDRLRRLRCCCCCCHQRGTTTFSSPPTLFAFVIGPTPLLSLSLSTIHPANQSSSLPSSSPPPQVR